MNESNANTDDGRCNISIAVVIPLFNGEPWIREALDSVLAQDCKPNDIIVVDDGSTDSSASIVSHYEGVTLLRNVGKGSSAARNRGLATTDSTYVAFLDQDDVWHPSHLRLTVESLEANPDANTAFAAASCFGDEALDYDANVGTVRDFDPWTRFPFTIGVDGPSLALMRRDAVIACGMWEECATGMGDALIFLKLASMKPLLKLGCRTVGKRIHASQQWLQVRELGASYLGFRHGVMSRALDFRRSRNPSDPGLPRLERNLEALRALQNLTAIIQSDKPEGASSVAHELETLLRDEPGEYLRHGFYCLMGALFKTYKVEELRQERDRVFARLLEYWPKDASRTRKVLRDLIGETPHIS